MMRSVLLAAIGAYSAIGAPAAAVNIAWLPVTDAERQMSAPIVDKGRSVRYHNTALTLRERTVSAPTAHAARFVAHFADV